MQNTPHRISGAVYFYNRKSLPILKIYILYIHALLYIYRKDDILNLTKRRRSILVSTAASEGGPKNPLKGIAMKPLVPA